MEVIYSGSYQDSWLRGWEEAADGFESVHYREDSADLSSLTERNLNSDSAQVYFFLFVRKTGFKILIFLAFCYCSSNLNVL